MARIVLLAVALVIAVVTALLVRNWLGRQEASGPREAAVERAAPAAEVLVAASRLPAGTVIAVDSFRWQAWPADNLHEGYIRKDGPVKPAEFTGGVVRRLMEPGEPVLSGKVAKPGSKDFLAGILNPGMRAFSLKVTPTTGAAGFIVPGSIVDVILTQDVRRDGEARAVVSETVLRAVRVIAVDQSLSDAEAKPKVPDTVTVEVTPKQAESLAVALDLGRISLSLRSLVRDETLEQQQGFTGQDSVSQYLEQTAVGRRVLGAARDLPVGTLLRDTDLVWQEIPPEASTEGLVLEARSPLALLRGAYLKAPVGAGQRFAADMLIRPGEQGFIAAALAPGMRAISVGVTQVSGVSGYIAPGDRVDVVLTHRLDDTSPNPVLSPRRFSETIVEDVRLLAIEQSVDPATGKPVIGQTATVEVTLKHAEALALGASMGELSLTLRSLPQAAEPRGGPGFTSDLAISRATIDFLSRGTRGAPELAGGGAEPATEGTSSYQAPLTIRVYRSTAGAAVTVPR